MKKPNTYIIGVREDIEIIDKICSISVEHEVQTKHWLDGKNHGLKNDEFQYHEFNRESDFVLIIVSKNFEQKFQNPDLRTELKIAHKWKKELEEIFDSTINDYQRCYIVSLDDISTYSDFFTSSIKEFSSMTNFQEGLGVYNILSHIKLIYKKMKEMFDKPVSEIFGQQERTLLVYQEQQSLSDLLFDHYYNNIRHFPVVVDKHAKQLLGLISLRDLYRHFPPDTKFIQSLRKIGKKIDFDDLDLKGTKVDSLNRTKFDNLITVQDDATIMAVTILLSEQHQVGNHTSYISAIPIVASNRIKDIVSYVDILKYSKPILKDVKISDCIMTRKKDAKLYEIKTNDTLADAFSEMKNKQVRHLLVFDEEAKKYSGIISDYVLIRNLSDKTKEERVEFIVYTFKEYRNGVSTGPIQKLKKDDPVLNFVETILNIGLIGSLPVFDKNGEEIEGIISYTDVLKEIIKRVEQK